MSVKDSVSFKGLIANNALVNAGESFKVRKGTFLIYHMGNSDDSLELQMSFDKDAKPTIVVNEISYDLLSNPIFEIKPRTNEMQPMPFLTNDAIMCIQKIKL